MTIQQLRKLNPTLTPTAAKKLSAYWRRVATPPRNIPATPVVPATTTYHYQPTRSLIDVYSTSFAEWLEKRRKKCE